MNGSPDIERDAADQAPNGSLPPKLLKFRNITGIHTVETLRNSHQAPRPGDNVGIYARVIKEEKLARRHYNLVNFLIEGTFMSQIAIAASLTALGASNASHIAITVLGSINTVIAGTQTYLKGQGLPTRIQQYEFGLRKLREHIEDLERNFFEPDCPLDVDKELKEIAEMYHAVRQTAEDNTPDTYKAMGGAGAKLLNKSATPLSRDSSAAAAPQEPVGTTTEEPGVPEEATQPVAEASGANEAQPNAEGTEATEETPLLKK